MDQDQDKSPAGSVETGILSATAKSESKQEDEGSSENEEEESQKTAKLEPWPSSPPKNYTKKESDQPQPSSIIEQAPSEQKTEKVKKQANNWIKYSFVAACSILFLGFFILLLPLIYMRAGHWAKWIAWARANKQEWQGVDKTVSQMSNVGYEGCWIIAFLATLLMLVIQVLGLMAALRPRGPPTNFYYLAVLWTDLGCIGLLLFIFMGANVLWFEVVHCVHELAQRGRDADFSGVPVLVVAGLMVYHQAKHEIAILSQDATMINESANAQLFAVLQAEYDCCGLFDYRDYWYTNYIVLQIEAIPLLGMHIGPVEKSLPELAVTSECLLHDRHLNVHKTADNLLHTFQDRLKKISLCFTPPSCCKAQPKVSMEEAHQCFDANKVGKVIEDNDQFVPYDKKMTLKSTPQFNQAAHEFKRLSHELLFPQLTQLEMYKVYGTIALINDLTWKPRNFTDTVKEIMRAEHIEAMFPYDLHHQGCLAPMLESTKYYVKLAVVLCMVFFGVFATSLAAGCITCWQTY